MSWSARNDAVGQAAEWEALQVHGPRAGEFRKKEALSAEKHRANALHHGDVVMDAFIESDNATGVDLESLASAEFFHDHGATGMYESQSITPQFLKDESLAAKEAGAKAFAECDGQFGAHGCTQEGLLLAEERAS